MRCPRKGHPLNAEETKRRLEEESGGVYVHQGNENAFLSLSWEKKSRKGKVFESEDGKWKNCLERLEGPQ